MDALTRPKKIYRLAELGYLPNAGYCDMFGFLEIKSKFRERYWGELWILKCYRAC